MDVLSVNNLSKAYGDVYAVKGVTFSLEENHITTLLGPNGSGKTTLLKCILGLIKPNNGELRLFNEHCFLPFPEPIKKRILYIPDEPITIDYLSGEENIKYMCALYGIKYEEKKAYTIFEKYDLFDSKDKLTKDYSRGMLQKLSLCFIDFYCPDLIVIDEPTNGLDVLTIQLLTEILTEICSEGRTILIATHDMSFCKQISSHIIFISKGTLIYDDTKEALYKEYGNIENAVKQLLSR